MLNRNPAKKLNIVHDQDCRTRAAMEDTDLKLGSSATSPLQLVKKPLQVREKYVYHLNIRSLRRNYEDHCAFLLPLKGR